MKTKITIICNKCNSFADEVCDCGKVACKVKDERNILLYTDDNDFSIKRVWLNNNGTISKIKDCKEMYHAIR